MAQTGRTEETKEPIRSALAQWVFTPLAGILLSDWLRLLKQRGRSIPPRYWPRTLFTTAMACGNSVLAPWERYRQSDKIEAAVVRAPIFIIGHHRSGTTHLWNLMATDSRLVYPTVLQAVFPHTFLTCEQAIHGMATRFTPSKRPQDNVEFSPDSPIEEERAICTSCFYSMQMFRHFPGSVDDFRRFLTMRKTTPAEQARWRQSLDNFARKLLVRRGGDATLLFKAPDHTGKIRLVLEQFPDARFIHIHRDPYKVYASTQQMEIATQSLYAYQQLDKDTLDEYILWRYKAMYDAFFEDVPMIPQGQFVDVAFTDLRNDPIGEVTRVGREIGFNGPELSALQGYVDSIAEYKMNKRPPLADEVRQRVAKRWKRCFDAWGYEV
ncbi:MAG: sulfotransferase [Deltaproteobacteria bacterium]|nr:sulfotransferase [Deltaproteobacteria bacterium]